MPYEIIGSDNFWYGSGLGTMKDVNERIKDIKEHIKEYADPETDETRTQLPKKLYIIKGKIVKEVLLRKVI
jgi:hypothetical protein